MKAIHVKEPGGPESMQLVDVPTPAPGPTQALVRIAATGVNFIDVYFRTGLYKADLPITPGSEAAGTVTAVGSEVTLVAPGEEPEPWPTLSKAAVAERLLDRVVALRTSSGHH